jgi:hypothetical protein
MTAAVQSDDWVVYVAPKQPTVVCAEEDKRCPELALASGGRAGKLRHVRPG